MAVIVPGKFKNIHELDGYQGFGYTCQSETESNTFKTIVKEFLSELSRIPLGAELIREIQNACPAARSGTNGSTSIQEIVVPPNVKVVFIPSSALFPGRATAMARDLKASEDGSGSVSFLFFSNRQQSITSTGLSTNYLIVNAHELIHCYHHVRGTRSEDEEEATTGLGVHQNNRFTENRFRAAIGLQRRTSFP